MDEATGGQEQRPNRMISDLISRGLMPAWRSVTYARHFTSRILQVFVMFVGATYCFLQETTPAPSQKQHWARGRVVSYIAAGIFVNVPDALLRTLRYAERSLRE